MSAEHALQALNEFLSGLRRADPYIGDIDQLRELGEPNAFATRADRLLGDLTGILDDIRRYHYK